ncbi:MAG: cupin domain-containing protein [Pseudomonadota bacterium]
MADVDENKGRVINTASAEYVPYDFGGPVLDGVFQMDLSYDSDTGHGAYLVKMAPGTVTTPHVHAVREEFMVLEGDIIESDGTVLGPGDYIIYEPGTEHCSRTETGAVLIGFDFQSPAQLTDAKAG